MPYLMLGSPVAVFPAFAQTTQFVGRSKAEVYCLRSGGLNPPPQSHVNNAG